MQRSFKCSKNKQQDKKVNTGYHPFFLAINHFGLIYISRSIMMNLFDMRVFLAALV